jgi:ring-1,2-phenylacetyl-CoA epoxidase subunit PaaC
MNISTDSRSTPDAQRSTEYLLRLGDSALILGQRTAEWCGHGPMLEEDIAMANIGLDLIGHARLCLAEAGARMSPPQSEDALAYFRDEAAFRNFTLCELPNSGIEKGQQARDYAVTITRNFLYSAFMVLLWERLQTSSEETLAGIAAKAVKEARYHLEHARDWLLRFGDGTKESHRRAQHVLNQLLPYCSEFFVDDDVTRALHAQGVAPLHADLQAPWDAMVDSMLAEATLTRPEQNKFIPAGHAGRHSEHLGFLLAEMQGVARAHPEAKW